MPPPSALNSSPLYDLDASFLRGIRFIINMRFGNPLLPSHLRKHGTDAGAKTAKYPKRKWDSRVLFQNKCCRRNQHTHAEAENDSTVTLVAKTLVYHSRVMMPNVQSSATRGLQH